LKIVAYYQAQRNVADASLGPVAEKILQRLREKFKDALGLVVGVMLSFEAVYTESND
jgi:hypothetical protein